VNSTGGEHADERRGPEGHTDMGAGNAT
jgi:hypothetical protein